MALSSCISYHEAPVNLTQDTEEWATVSAAVCKDKRLNCEQMIKTGLLLNRELNHARLKLAKSTCVAEFAGLWSDPAIACEVERVFGENITNNALAPSLTLPVTGLPALAEKIAEQYKEADYWKMRQTERRYMAELECLRFRILVSEAKWKSTQDRLAVIQEEQKRISKLCEQGEIGLASFQIAVQRLNDARRAEKKLRTEHLNLLNTLIEKLGLHPSVGSIELTGSLPKGVPTAASMPSPEELLNAPSLLALQAEYGASESELKAEIRKQYPELGITPSFGRDGGYNQASIGFSIPLPLWNRNRGSIAKASGDRELKQAELITGWRHLVQQAALGYSAQNMLRQQCLEELAGC